MIGQTSNPMDDVDVVARCFQALSALASPSREFQAEERENLSFLLGTMAVVLKKAVERSDALYEQKVEETRSQH